MKGWEENICCKFYKAPCRRRWSGRQLKYARMSLLTAMSMSLLRIAIPLAQLPNNQIGTQQQLNKYCTRSNATIRRSCSTLAYSDILSAKSCNYSPIPDQFHSPFTTYLHLIYSKKSPVDSHSTFTSGPLYFLLYFASCFVSLSSRGRRLLWFFFFLKAQGGGTHQ